MKKFCPNCGTEGTKENPLLEKFCQNCYLEMNPLIKEIKDPKIKICAHCGAYVYKGRFLPAENKDPIKNTLQIIEKLVNQSIIFEPSVQIQSLKVIPNLEKILIKPNRTNQIEILITFKGNVKGSKLIKEEYNLNTPVEFIVCKECQRQRSSYYEAILQIRPKSKEIVEFVKKQIEYRSDVSITNVKESKHGIDLYLSNQTYARHLGKTLKGKFGGEIKISTTLYGRKDGKDIYRSTILFRHQ